MTGVRRALIVATQEYSDPGLSPLRGPALDAEALASVLEDPEIGKFDVTTVLNEPAQRVRIEVARFFKAGKPADTLLVHFTGHGVKDDAGELYFAAQDTDLTLLDATAVSSAYVRKEMDRSRAGRIVCLVDCCYSGAFTKATKSAAVIDINERLTGKGRAVITASTGLQLAQDGGDDPSPFTHAIVRGLRSGEADRDEDGMVSLDELYDYAYDHVTEVNPDQTPQKSSDMQGAMYVAWRKQPGAQTQPIPIVGDVADRMRADDHAVRRTAVASLREQLLTSADPGERIAARTALEDLQENDADFEVKTQALAAIRASTAGSPAEPVTEPVTPRPSPPDPQDHRRRALLGARRTKIASSVGGAVVLLSVLGLTLWPNGSDPGGGEEPKSDPAVLGEDELLVSIRTEADDGRLYRVDTLSGESAEVPGAGYLPTVTADRTSMLVMRGPRAGPKIAYLSDLQDARRATLLNRDALFQCPYSSRPAPSPDGGMAAVVCLTADEQSLGLYVVTVETGEINPVLVDAAIAGSPSWGGDGRLYYARRGATEDAPWTIWSVPWDLSEGELQHTFGDAGGSDSQPDWSENGLLFVRHATASEVPTFDGDVMLLEGRRETQLTTSGQVRWASWAPDGERYAYVSTARSGEQAIMIGRGRDKIGELPFEGVIGPPAWGTR